MYQHYRNRRKRFNLRAELIFEIINFEENEFPNKSNIKSAIRFADLVLDLSISFFVQVSLSYSYLSKISKKVEPILTLPFIWAKIR